MIPERVEVDDRAHRETPQEHDPDENGFPTFKDGTDGTVWNIEGVAVEGPKQGSRLARMPAVEIYWFVWATFFPGSSIELL